MRHGDDQQTIGQVLKDNPKRVPMQRAVSAIGQRARKPLRVGKDAGDGFVDGKRETYRSIGASVSVPVERLIEIQTSPVMELNSFVHV
jgi:hypothetical protein